MAHSEYMKRYNRTLKGFLVLKHAKMVQRARGHNGPKDHLYKGLPVISPNSFYSWALSTTNIHEMFSKYKKSGWKYSLCPSIDRINPKEGYILGNMRFITMKENQDLGRINSSKVRRVSK